MSRARPGAVLDPGLLRTRGGTVDAFDEPAGIGAVRDDDGTTHPFHCTAIADGSRSIAVGAVVRYVLAPGHGGTFEARDVVELSQRPAPLSDLEIWPTTDP